jgi:HK97 family phage major capsid protein
MNEIEKLKARLAELSATSAGIVAKADAEKRDLTVDEANEIDALTAESDSVFADITRRERIVAQAARLATPEPRRTVAPPVASDRPGEPVTNAAPRDGLMNTRLRTHEERARWGFQNMGEFASCVRTAVVAPSNMDQRLIQNAAATTYGSEAAGADGGFAVPPEWRSEIMKLVDAEGSLLGMTDQQTVTGNTITYPIDETTAHQSTGGIQAYWDQEAAAMTQSKPALKELTIKLNRLTALVPVTEELLEDTAAMAGYITGKAGEKLAFKVNDAIINGTGVGQPLGIMNAPCRVSVAKITSQVGNTIHGKNVAAMMARMPASSFGNAVWLANQDCLPQIMALGFNVTDGTTTNAGAGAIWMAPGQLQNGSPYGQILGRPVIITEACAALGTVGDFILADLSKYLAVVKGALRSDVSIHLWFDQAISAFRFILRMNGQPWLSAAIARKNGSNTLSHFVTLDTRAP